MNGCMIRRAIRTAHRDDTPYPHWLLHDVLPAELASQVIALPFDTPLIDDTHGKRETHNSSRIFVSEENRARYPACEALAESFQDEATIALLEDVCGHSLAGSSLRIECCLDTDGFWLEPHTDIGAKRFTMLVYLSDHPDAADWGTDIYDGDLRLASRATGAFNTGLIFLPAPDTWHGFARRPIRGVRRSLIINYVAPEWRSRHELAYPTQPVLRAG
jgi:hypothetical protein